MPAWTDCWELRPEDFADRVDAFEDVVPERMQVRRLREDAGHADDRDRRAHVGDEIADRDVDLVADAVLIDDRAGDRARAVLRIWLSQFNTASRDRSRRRRTIALVLAGISDESRRRIRSIR